MGIAEKRGKYVASAMIVLMSLAYNLIMHFQLKDGIVDVMNLLFILPFTALVVCAILIDE